MTKEEATRRARECVKDHGHPVEILKSSTEEYYLIRQLHPKLNWEKREGGFVGMEVVARVNPKGDARG